MPKLTINGIEIEVERGTSIIQAAEQLGIEIPRFCYHDRLSVPANCRMCLVEVEGGPPKPVASCAMACADDMVVHTDTEMVHKARKGVMEFLLINHPLDCPICDQGGECDLQDQAVAYGFDRSRYHENKRSVKNKNLGPLINTIMTRCIQCTRCVRFGDEVAGVSELGLLHRGEDVEIDTFIEQSISSELSGNMIDVCPVGALTSKPYQYKARPWELTKTESIDVHDAVGSNIRVDSRSGEVLRVLPRLHEDVNEEWISDKTRFACDGLTKRRLDKPWVRDDATGKLRAASWEEALELVAKKFKAVKPENRAVFAGDMMDLESMVAMKDLAEALGGADLECRVDGARFDPKERAGYLYNTGIAATQDADAILIVGSNPRTEAPILNARIRKNWVDNQVKVAVIGEEVDLTYPYEYLGEGPADLETLLKAKSGFAKILKDAEKPMIIVGMGAFRRADSAAIHALTKEVAEHFGMITDEWNGYNVLHNAASRVGALDIGFANDKPIELKAKSFVYLLGADFVTEDISNKAFVVYQGHHGDVGAHYADVILPGAAYTEKSAMYVNTEGRVQKTRLAVYPPGEAREDWKIIRAISEYAKVPLAYNNLLELRARMTEEWKHLGELDVKGKAKWKKFGKSGKVKAEPFENPVKNFYMTNPIARASSTMAECTKMILEAHDAEVAEAAE